MENGDGRCRSTWQCRDKDKRIDELESQLRTVEAERDALREAAEYAHECYSEWACMKWPMKKLKAALNSGEGE